MRDQDVQDREELGLQLASIRQKGWIPVIDGESSPSFISGLASKGESEIGDG